MDLTERKRIKKDVKTMILISKCHKKKDSFPWTPTSWALSIDPHQGLWVGPCTQALLWFWHWWWGPWISAWPRALAKINPALPPPPPPAGLCPMSMDPIKALEWAQSGRLACIARFNFDISGRGPSTWPKALAKIKPTLLMTGFVESWFYFA